MVSKWRKYADGEIHELTAEEVQERHGKSVRLFEKSLRVYASSHGLKCSVEKTEDGLRFRIWQISEADAYLPRDVVMRESGVGLNRFIQVSHAGCTHPATKNERDKCRKERGQFSPSQLARRGKGE